MNDEELATALSNKNWHIIWIKALHGTFCDEQVKVILASDAPDWLKNVFGTLKKVPDNGVNPSE